MTYPSPPPGPFGQGPWHSQQPTGPYGQSGQKPDWQQPGFPGGRPPKNKIGLVAAVMGITVLVLGVSIYLLTNNDDEPSTSAVEDPTGRSEGSTSGNEEPTSGEERTDEPTGADGGGSPEEDALATAQSYADAVNSENEQAATQVSCDPTAPGILYETVGGSGVELSIGEAQVSGDGSVLVEFFIGDGEALLVPLLVQGDAWCVEY
jgi:hypothetical protein